MKRTRRAATATAVALLLAGCTGGADQAETTVTTTAVVQSVNTDECFKAIGNHIAFALVQTHPQAAEAVLADARDQLDEAHDVVLYKAWDKGWETNSFDTPEYESYVRAQCALELSRPREV